ncbi:hypothetical protein MKW98_001440 [Papaver atlanticum]|uniref:Uncharacterized protein n=1 Tax=Papaver atlanticum TaxID=357466 RepID=A0AAD4SXF4_9MAGN|nr:hypothetical protein MKW98_001440 [Papaver atlanticum]
MTLLGSCWYITEKILIPDGFEKWYCLSFYVNPFFLIFCQFFLWFKVAGIWLSFIISQPLSILWIFSVWVLQKFKMYVIHFISFAKSNNSNVLQDALEIEVTEYFDAFQQIFDESSSKSIIKFQRGSTDFSKQVLVVHGNENLQELLNVLEDTLVKEAKLVCQNLDDIFLQESFSHPDEVDADLDISDEPLPLSCSLESSFDHIEENKLEIVKQEEEIDPFYKKYLERMRWFDLLNQERTCGINSIFNKQLGSISSTLEYMEPRDIASPFMSKIDKRKLMRSLESDIEKVYVGQTCLCWEALNHQYRKVEALCATNGFFYDNVAGNFQKFQVLLERFIENERAESKRFWNYVEGRFSLKSLLQVPKVSGYFEEENEGLKGESMRAREVLAAIENSIRAFIIFINTEDKKPWWKFRSSLWTCPQVVEDPKDLQVVADLTKQLQQKQLLLKGIEGKKKCWMNKDYYHQHHHQEEVLEESQTIRGILFCTIELKLVSRVLNMSLISTSQIRWCQEKLNSNEIEFNEGRIIVKSTCSSGFCILFPP